MLHIEYERRDCLLTVCSSPPILPFPIWHEHRRALGFEGIEPDVQGEEEVQLLVDELSIECAGQRWKST